MLTKKTTMAKTQKIDGEALTVERLKIMLDHPGHKKSVTQKTVDLLLDGSEEERRIYRENLLSFTRVSLGVVKHSANEFVRAVKFVSHIMLGETTVIAYKAAHPERYENLVKNGTTPSRIASYAVHYKGTALVVKMLEQATVSSKILNHSVYQEAINKQREIMLNPKASFNVQQRAAESLMTHLAPTGAAAQIEVNVNNTSPLVENLMEQTLKLAAKQRELIENRVLTAGQVASIPVEVTDYVDVTPE